MADPIRAALERLVELETRYAAQGADPDMTEWDNAIAAARAALAAAPEGEGPSESDVANLFYRHMGEGSEVGFENAIAEALARWGRFAARAALAAAPEGEPSWCETDPEQRAWQAGREARDDVMLRRAALPPNYIDPEYQGEDLELLQTFYAACRAEGGTADEIHLRGLRAVLAARPTSPATPLEGEVAELVAWLRRQAGKWQAIDRDAGLTRSLVAEHFTRAADLLEQRHPAPVPVSERLPGHVEQVLIKAECALADIAEGEAEENEGDSDALLSWAEQRAAAALARIRPVMREHGILTSEWPPLPAHALPLPSGEVGA